MARALREWALVLLLTIAVASIEHTLSYIQVALGLGCMGLAGAAGSRLLGLRALPSLAYIATLGQLLLVAYFYLRSALAKLWPAAHITGTELYAILGAAVAMAVWPERHRLPLAWARFRRAASWPVAAYVLIPTGPLCVILHRKLRVLCLPSSDPDVHAYFAKQMIEAGSILSTTLTNSDVSLNYPTGFAALTTVWSLLTGLAAPQLTGALPYIQYFLWLGLTFAMLTRFRLRTGIVLPVALLVFVVLPCIFNPLLMHGREHLEGTARLAHTSLLMFAMAFLFCNRQHHQGKRPAAVWLILALTIAFGACINPAHGPFVGLVAWMAHLALRPPRLSWHRGAMQAMALLILALGVFVSQDAYYRASFIDPLWLGGAGHAAPSGGLGYREENGPPAPLLQPTGLGTLAARLQEPAALRQFWEFVGMDPPLRHCAGWLLLIWLGSLSVFVIATRRRKLPAAARWMCRLASLGVGLAVASVCVVTCIGACVNLDNPAGFLLVNYAMWTHYQVLALLYPVLMALPLVLWGLTDPPARVVSYVIVAVMLLPMTAHLESLMLQARPVILRLRACALGNVTPDDVALAQWADANIAPDERVLLPGLVMDTGRERWIFPQAGAQAYGLYASVKTAFFFGIDGRRYTAKAYRDHVGEHFDAAWLAQENILWAADNGVLPASVLATHYNLAKRIGNARLYRLH